MKISILLPLYNGENFLDECYQSIENQTYKKWNLYIGINGHGLNSELYKKISKKYENNKKVIIKEYDVKSKPLTLNLLSKEIDTEFVALIDVDDKWNSLKLEYQIPKLKNYDIVGTAGKYFGDKQHKINIEVGEITYEKIFFHNCFINSSVIMKREDVDFDDVFLDDYNMWLKLITKNRKFYNLPEILCYHRLHSESFFNGTNNNSVKELKEKWLKYYGKHKIMMDRFGVTVILPLMKLNYEKQDLKITIDSVLNQNWKGFEFYIVINSDNIINLLKELINNNYNEEQKTFLKIIKIKDKSITNPKITQNMLQLKIRQYYNKCMRIGSYNLIAFIELKDIWKENKLFHQIYNIEGYDAMCVNGEYYGKKKGRPIQLQNRTIENSDFYRSAVLIKRKRFNGKYPYHYSGKTFLFHPETNLVKLYS